jgi:membrane protease YdiL (CAAX protease family)
MQIMLLSLMLIITVAMAAIGAQRVIKLSKVPISERLCTKLKCGTYYQILGGLWGATLVVLIVCFIAGISFEDIGFRSISFNYGFWFTTVTLVLSGLLLAYGLRQMISSLVSAKFREAVEKQMEDSAANAILPRSKKEKRIFVFLSFSAGVCEEIIYRGFLFFALYAMFPDISIFLVVLISGILFGISHLYQGLAAIISGVIGALLMCLFLVTDSLILVILLHFLYDLTFTFLLSEKGAE